MYKCLIRECCATILISIAIFIVIFGCKPVETKLNVNTPVDAPSMERGLNVNIGPNQPDPSRAIQMLSTRVTDLERRVSALETPVKPIPDFPQPRQ